MTLTTISFDDAMTRGIITTLQTAQLRGWISNVSSLRNLSPDCAGAEQVATICRGIIKRDFHASERQWARIQQSYWLSTDGYGRLNLSRLALITHY